MHKKIHLSSMSESSNAQGSPSTNSADSENDFGGILLRVIYKLKETWAQVAVKAPGSMKVEFIKLQ